MALCGTEEDPMKRALQRQIDHAREGEARRRNLQEHGSIYRPGEAVRSAIAAVVMLAVFAVLFFVAR